MTSPDNELVNAILRTAKKLHDGLRIVNDILGKNAEVDLHLRFTVSHTSKRSPMICAGSYPSSCSASRS
jgi:hypothetical protein